MVPNAPRPGSSPNFTIWAGTAKDIAEAEQPGGTCRVQLITGLRCRAGYPDGTAQPIAILGLLRQSETHLLPSMAYGALCVFRCNGTEVIALGFLSPSAHHTFAMLSLSPLFKFGDAFAFEDTVIMGLGIGSVPSCSDLLYGVVVSL